MSRKLLITLMILVILSVMSRMLISMQFGMWDFNDENDYKTHHLSYEEILEYRKNNY